MFVNNVFFFEVNVCSPNWLTLKHHCSVKLTHQAIFKWCFVAGKTIEKGGICDHKCMAALHFLISLLPWLRGKQWNIQLVNQLWKDCIYIWIFWVLFCQNLVWVMFASHLHRSMRNHIVACEITRKRPFLCSASTNMDTKTSCTSISYKNVINWLFCIKKAFPSFSSSKRYLFFAHFPFSVSYTLLLINDNLIEI